MEKVEILEFFCDSLLLDNAKPLFGSIRSSRCLLSRLWPDLVHEIVPEMNANKYRLAKNLWLASNFAVEHEFNFDRNAGGGP